MRPVERGYEINFLLELISLYAKLKGLKIIKEGLRVMPELDFEKGNGLLPAIAQDYNTGKVLMLAYINKVAWEKSLETGEVHYWSRSRKELWHKGATSGHVQKIREIFIDCDSDSILFKIDQIGGAACHTGFESCFFKKIESDGSETIIGKKLFDPDEVYKK